MCVCRMVFYLEINTIITLTPFLSLSHSPSVSCLVLFGYFVTNFSKIPQTFVGRQRMAVSHCECDCEYECECECE